MTDASAAAPQPSIGDRAWLKRASIKGLGINMAAQMVRFALQFLYQIAMARLLDPEDFGLVALSAPLIGFVQLFADLGLSQATIQRAEISQEQLTALFWINVLVGFALMAIAFGLAPVAGWFYGDPRVVTVTQVSALLFAVSGFFSQHYALLNRTMRFGRLVVLDLASFLIGAAAGIAAALVGWGYWAIIANQVVICAVTLILAWALSGWRPSLPGRASGMGSILRFGADLTGFNLVNYLARNLDNVLIGRFNGELSLGFYDRAYKLLLLPLNQISAPLSRVAVPMLSRSMAEPDTYRRAFLRTLDVVMILTYPGVAFALGACPQLIDTVLGPKWAGVSPIFAVLALSAPVATIGNCTGWLFISQGRARDMRNTGLVSSAIYILSFAAGLPWGPVGVAACYTAASIGRVPFIWRAATRVGPVAASDLPPILLPCLLGFAVAGLTSFGLVQVLPSNVAVLGLLLALSYALFLGVQAVFPARRRALHQMLRQVVPARTRART